MVYRLSDNGLKISAGYKNIDPDRHWQYELFGVQEPSAKFFHPDAVDERARRAGNPMATGYAVDPASIPRKVLWCSPQMDGAPDVDHCCGNLLISERVRDVIESFASDVRQFLPVDVYVSARPQEPAETPAARSFWLAAGQEFDAVSGEHTHHERSLIKYPDGRTKPGVWRFRGDAPVVFDRAAVAGRHLWVDLNFVNTEHPFVSDALGGVLLAMDPHGACFQHFDEV